jgi:hypothetical protein
MGTACKQRDERAPLSANETQSNVGSCSLPRPASPKDIFDWNKYNRLYFCIDRETAFGRGGINDTERCGNMVCRVRLMCDRVALRKASAADDSPHCQCADRSPWPIGDGARTIPTDPEGPKNTPGPEKRAPTAVRFPCRGSPCDDKGKGDVDESFDEAAAVSFRAHHQRRGVRHHDRDPAPRIEVRPGLLGCNRTKNCFSGSECGGRSAKHVNCRKAMR